MNLEEDSDSVESKKKKLEDYVLYYDYKIRSCNDYATEYHECKRIKGRFHQYFINGEFSDCTGLKNDRENCYLCREGNMEACAKLIQSADDLLKRRMKAHLANDIWEKRTKPPEDWNKPLPDFIIARNSFNYLDKETPEKNCIIM